VPDEALDKNELLLREAAKLLGMLFIGRREALAFHNGKHPDGQWYMKRRKYKIDDFRNHLFGTQCMGAYLLDADSMVRTIVFDVDLKEDGEYFLIGDDTETEDGEPAVDGNLEIEKGAKVGDLESALHDETHPAHRWAASLIRSTVDFIQREVMDQLSLTCTIIITGGGAHVFVPFGQLIPASEARAMAHSVMDGIPIFTRKSENFYVNREGKPSVEIEVFPKQDGLKDITNLHADGTPESLGNLIRLPFGMHERGMRTYALDPALPQLPSWRLKKLRSMDALRLQGAMLDLEWDVVD
jgi:hypothetical protein